jgi:hypothetical protein
LHHTATRATVLPALTRWGVPFLDKERKGDAVDVVHLEAARAKWAEEKRAQLARKEARLARPRRAVGRPKGNGHEVEASDSDVVRTIARRVDTIVDQLAELLDKLDALKNAR